LELANLVAGTKYRGEFEERLQSIVKELTDPKAPPTILFIDEIHNLVGAGAAEGGMDAGELCYFRCKHDFCTAVSFRFKCI
jgi:ATP-dependent Clp protease ATP-binding subunit ClpA